MCFTIAYGSMKERKMEKSGSRICLFAVACEGEKWGWWKEARRSEE